jgi:osmoprotectant transport system permease protein
MVRYLALLLFVFVSEASLRADEPPAVRIGSKTFNESVILGEMLAHSARAAGAEVRHLRDLGGTEVLWRALRNGDIDAYPEYTGTITQQILVEERIRSTDELIERLKGHGIHASAPLGFNNTYALGMPRERAAELGIESIADLVDHPDLRFGFSFEFLERSDGWPGLKARYRLPHESVRGMDHTLAYEAIRRGAIDVMDLYSTDAEIEDYDLVTLADVERYFPEYEAIILYRADLAERAPEIVAAFHRLEGTIDDDTMRQLNARAKIDKEPESRIAADFLNETLQLGIATDSNEFLDVLRRRTGRFLINTREHLVLVAVSLSLAVVVAIPLGVLAYKCETLTGIVMGIVGVIQTMPSLALLVFMIPLFGLGAMPAIAALFLYSLLPIVRNTLTGLQQIPLSLKESALVLGLTGRQRLWLIELPMTSPSILAGIKTAAVINVGTATLGALINAGGYGQPILTGLRLGDTGLLLQGAIPAALLALVVQWFFGVVETWVVPKGLRLKAE